MSHQQLIPADALETEVPPEFRAEYTDDNYIHYAQNIRRKIVAKIMVDGDVPNDEDGRKELAMVMNDLATTAIQNKRIQSNETKEASMRDVALLLAQVSAKMEGGDPFKAIGGTNQIRGLDTRVLESIPLLPGEVTLGNIQESKEEFLDRMEK